MKKVYTAPEILFESFTMSTNIAAGCDEIERSFSQDSCAYTGTGGIAMFLDAIVACEYKSDDDGSNGFCYHVPGEENDLFAS